MLAFERFAASEQMHAFNSPVIEPMLAFERFAASVDYSEPQIPLITNVTDQVQFATGMQTLHEQGGFEVFVEIGPRPVLLEMGQQCLPEGVGVFLPSLTPSQNDWQQLLESLGALYVNGVEIDWAGFDQDYSRHRVALPTYPFQRRRYWIEAAEARRELGELGEQSLCLKVKPTEFLQQLKGVPANEGRALLVDYVRSQVSRILGLNSSKLIDLQQEFFNLGMDSMTSMELRNSLKDSLGCSLPSNLIFNYPTVEALVNYLAQKVITLNSPLEDRTRGVVEFPSAFSSFPLSPPPLVSPSPCLPLSFFQQPYWLLEHLAHGNPHYNANAPLVLSLTGLLDVNVLEASINEIVLRHEILRATFPTKDGKPVMVILPSLTLKLMVVNLQMLPEQEQKVEVERRTAEEIKGNFDLIQGPLLRAKLLKLGEEKHMFIFTMHHLVADGWSMGVLSQELTTLYQAFSHGMRSPLPELPIQYVDYAQWQQQWLQGEVLAAGLSYWKNKLADASPTLLPIDHPQPPFLTFSYCHHSVVLSQEFVASVNAFSHCQGVTPFITMLTALKLLLFKWTEQTDLVVGIVSANRAQSEIEKLIGCFVNFLPIRSKVSGDLVGLSVLQQVKSTVLETYNYQDLPFVKLVEALNHNSKLNLNSVYNVAFLMQNFQFDKKFIFSNKLEADYLSLDPQATPLDLRFIAIAENSSGEMYLECEYSPDLFEARTVKYLLASYYKILRHLVEYPETKLSQFHLVEELQLKATEESRSVGAVPCARPEFLSRGEFISTIEVRVANIFAEVLGVNQIGIYDNFFSLGGELSQAYQIFGRLKETFQVELGVDSLIQSPTVTGLAGIILHKQAEEAENKADILLKLEQLSDEEVESLIKQDNSICSKE
jgi:acyl carrier protein